MIPLPDQDSTPCSRALGSPLPCPLTLTAFLSSFGIDLRRSPEDRSSPPPRPLLNIHKEILSLVIVERTREKKKKEKKKNIEEKEKKKKNNSNKKIRRECPRVKAKVRRRGFTKIHVIEKASGAL